MSLDHFNRDAMNPAESLSPEKAARVYGVIGWLAQRLKVAVVGTDQVPTGRALIVANHTFGWDVAFAMHALWEEQRRTVWALGEHAWWRVPFLRKWASDVGTVDGTRENIDTLLARDELVLVLPGGLRESVKPRELRYRLLWGNRFGFIRAAIRAGAPIVPLACIGADDLFDLVGNAYRRGERWLPGSGIPIPLPSRILPIPHLVRFRYAFGAPIDLGLSPDRADDMDCVRRARHEVQGALHELLDFELARRAGVEIGW